MSAPLPDSQAEKICSMFDSFCKTVLRNASRNLKKQKEKKDEKEIVVEEPLKLFFDLRGSHEDIYPSEQLVIYADGFSCVVYSEALYSALLALPQDQLTVLLLDFWYGWKDQQISDHLEVSTRTVYNLRQRAFTAIRCFYEQREE